MKRVNNSLDWEPLAIALRNELREYGWLICLLEEQQRLIFFRDSEALVNKTQEIEKHIELIMYLKNIREASVDKLRITLNMNNKMTVEDVIDCLEMKHQGLLRALLDEVISTVNKVKDKVNNNQNFLIKALEDTKRQLNILEPIKKTYTYNNKGSVKKIQNTSALKLTI